jgi:hypothetical protein
MNTENIKTIFKDYLNAENSNYALLLNGDWGSGKSFFWKNTLKEIVKKEDFTEIYISLNGISKIETLEHMLFIKLIPFIGSKDNSVLKNATTLATNVVNKVSSHFLKTSISDIFKGVSVDAFNFSKYVICFDDLERSQIPVKEVLGFINNYVEHKNLKTIILADEEEINKAQKDESYNNIKEKLIGRIINFKLDIKETLPELFKKHKTHNTDFYDFLVIYEEYMTAIFIEYKQQNLRTITFYLGILAKIHPLIFDQNDKFIKEIILFSAIVTIEFKNGNIVSKQFDKLDEFAGYNKYTFKSRTLLDSSKKNGTDGEKVKTKKEIFKETYLEKREDEYNLYPSVYSFILSGYLNEEDLKLQLINKNKAEFGTPESIAFNTLLNYKFRTLSDSDFEKLCIDVKSYAQKGSYSLYDYSQIANFYYYFEQNKLIRLTSQEIKDFLTEGLNECAKRKEISQSVFDNLFHFKAENEQVAEIKELIKDFHNEIKKEQDIEKSNELVKHIENNDGKLVEKIFQKFNLSTDLFKYIVSDTLFTKIINTENSIIETFTELIGSRYTSTNIGEYLYEDIELLEELKNMLTNYLTEDSLIRPLKRFIMENLKDQLNTVCEHIEKTKKK